MSNKKIENTSRKGNLIRLLIINCLFLLFVILLGSYCGFDASGESCNRIERFIMYLLAAIVILIVSYKYDHGKYFKIGVLIDCLTIVFVIIYFFG